MNKRQLLTIFIAIIALITLYFGGNTKPPIGKATPAKQSVIHTSIDNELMQYERENQDESFIILISALEEKLNAQSEDSVKFEILGQLKKAWVGKSALMTAIYAEQSADLFSMKADREEVAGLYMQAIEHTHADSAYSNFVTQKIISIRKQQVESDESNLDYKVALANAYVDYTPNTMDGVQILLKVIEADINHPQANFTLGKLAILSGQYEKAIGRFQRLINNDHATPQVYVYIAEAYERLGDVDNAINALEECKKIIKSEDFKEDIDQHIDQLKNLNS